MPQNILVSVIIPTKNSGNTLEQYLNSIKSQTYHNTEIIIDNYSTDTTEQIAKRFTNHFYARGPERSAHVNFGVTKAIGEYVHKVDSDFILDPKVIAQCAAKAAEDYGAVVVHNTPDVTVSWIAKICKFEVDMYKYDLTHSSGRFVNKEVYGAIGGFNEKITTGEDYDLQSKLNRRQYKTGFIDAEALQLGEPTQFWPHMKKYYIYGRNFIVYKSNNVSDSKGQLGFFRNAYRRNWKSFIAHPVTSISFNIYNALKYLAGGSGYLMGRLRGEKP